MTKERITKIFQKLNDKCVFMFLRDTYRLPNRENVKSMMGTIDRPMLLSDDLYAFDVMNLSMMVESKYRDDSTCMGLVTVQLPDARVHLVGFYISEDEEVIYIETSINTLIYEPEYTPLSVIV